MNILVIDRSSLAINQLKKTVNGNHTIVWYDRLGNGLELIKRNLVDAVIINLITMREELHEGELFRMMLYKKRAWLKEIIIIGLTDNDQRNHNPIIDLYWRYNPDNPIKVLP